jgi:hypothetical protein
VKGLTLVILAVLAGTDPTNSASAFHVTAIEPEGNRLRVFWQGGPGKTNRIHLVP